MSIKGGHKVSIIVPAYNEGAHIADNIREFIEAGENFDYDYELIIVDDGSTDNTFEEASKFNSDKVKIISYPENQGKGHALRMGVNEVTGDMVTFIDADLQLHPKQIATFLEYLKNGHDIVIGSKRHPYSDWEYPLKRRILSIGYQTFIRLLFGMNIKDTQTGLKLFRKGILKEVLPKVLVKRYAFDLEVLAIANSLGYKITEAPIELKFRENGSSGIDWKSIWKIFIDTCAIFYRLKILKYYDKVR